MDNIKRLLIVAVMCFIAGCATTSRDEGQSIKKPVSIKKNYSAESIKMIADFDNGLKPNNLGGDFGAWDKDPADNTQFCESSFSANEKISDIGFSMKLEYDVDSREPAYNGFWMKLENADFSAYDKIAFSVKGDENKGFTDKFVIELKNAKGEVGKSMVGGITGNWQEKIVPFRVMSGITDFTQMTEFVIVFDDQNSRPEVGTIYIDSIYVFK